MAGKDWRSFKNVALKRNLARVTPITRKPVTAERSARIRADRANGEIETWKNVIPLQVHGPEHATLHDQQMANRAADMNGRWLLRIDPRPIVADPACNHADCIFEFHRIAREHNFEAGSFLHELCLRKAI